MDVVEGVFKIKYNMVFLQSCFIRKNTPELRCKLEKLGYHICPCSLFDGSVWLSTNIESSSVHGKGFVDNSGWSHIDAQHIALAAFLFDAQDDRYIDCGDNEELFITLAALRDDTNEHQWFIATDTLWDENYDGEITTYFEKGQWFKYDEWSYIEDLPSYFRKATVPEIIAHFNK